MLKLAKEKDELASVIVVCGMVPNDISLRQVVESDFPESLAEAAQKKKHMHTMKVFGFAARRRSCCSVRCHGRQSFPRLVMYPKQTLERQLVTVTGGDAEFIQELIASGLLGSAEEQNSGTEGHARGLGFRAHGNAEQQRSV